MTLDDERVDEILAGLCEDLISCIDEFLAGTSGRSLIDSVEVQDFCLDMRQIISKKL